MDRRRESEMAQQGIQVTKMDTIFTHLLKGLVVTTLIVLERSVLTHIHWTWI